MRAASHSAARNGSRHASQYVYARVFALALRGRGACAAPYRYRIHAIVVRSGFLRFRFATRSRNTASAPPNTQHRSSCPAVRDSFLWSA